MVSATRRCDLRPTVFFDGTFLVQGAKGIRDGNAIRMPFAEARPHRSPPPTWGLPPQLCWQNPEPHIGKVYELTGPESLTMAELAEEFSGALGRTIQYVNVPPQIWEAKLRELQLPAHLVAHLDVPDPRC
jgi:uncharacterized protein YbjT (DUF2867 family)